MLPLARVLLAMISTARGAPAAPAPALSPADVATGLAAVRGPVDACRRVPRPPGAVEVEVHVAGAGGVEAVTVWSAPNLDVARCVASAVQPARFPVTAQGGVFRHRYRF